MDSLLVNTGHSPDSSHVAGHAAPPPPPPRHNLSPAGAHCLRTSRCVFALRDAARNGARDSARDGEAASALYRSPGRAEGHAISLAACGAKQRHLHAPSFPRLRPRCEFLSCSTAAPCAVRRTAEPYHHAEATAAQIIYYH